MLWLSFFVVEMMILLPATQRGETLADARWRSGHALLWDPLLYIGIAIVLIALSQWLNSGSVLEYRSDADIWQFTPPPVSWLPASINTSTSFTRFATLFGSIVVAMALRVSISRSSARILLRCLTLISGTLALFALGALFYGIDPFPEMLLNEDGWKFGSFFGIWMVIAAGLLAEALERSGKRSIVQLLFVLGFVCNLTGMLFFANIFLTGLYLAVTLILFFYWIIYLRPNIAGHTLFKLVIATLLYLALTVVLLKYIFPDNLLYDKLATLMPFREYQESFWAGKKIRSHIALDIWRAHPWVGVGVDGYRHHLGLIIKPHEWIHFQTNQSAVFNNWLQFLCEYGVLGSALILAAIVMIINRIIMNLRHAWMHPADSVASSNLFLLRLSPLVFCGLFVILLTLFDSFISSPMQAPALLVSWVVVANTIPVFLPASNKRQKGNSQQGDWSKIDE